MAPIVACSKVCTSNVFNYACVLRAGCFHPYCWERKQMYFSVKSMATKMQYMHYDLGYCYVVTLLLYVSEGPTSGKNIFPAFPITYHMRKYSKVILFSIIF